jgi:site-specific DNA recombinase
VRGGLWRDTAIRGHRQRGTGLLNNELYVGRLVLNRLRYVKDPTSGRRLSRLNPPEAWIVTAVPDLRIVDEALWDRVKRRQAEIDADPKVRAIKASRFWERRRPVHLLTGRVSCGHCGGDMAAVGRDYLACSNARKLKQCEQRKSIRRAVLEDFVLDLIRDRMMQPDAVRAFVAAYTREVNAGRSEAEANQARQRQQAAALSAKLDGLYDAVAGGLRTPGLLAKIEGLEADRARLEVTLSRPTPSPDDVQNLSHICRGRRLLSGCLRGAWNGREARGEADGPGHPDRRGADPGSPR